MINIRNFIPNQHGAWAMLVLPYVLALLVTQVAVVHVLLFVCWLLAYLMSFYVLQLLRSRKASARTMRPIYLYGGLLVGFGGWLLLIRPDLSVYGLLFLPMFAVNAHFAFHKQERALLNDFAAVLQFGLIIFVVRAAGGGGSWDGALVLYGLCVLYFIGTVFYVKTMIREKNNPLYYKLSILYHSLALVVGSYLLGWLLIPMSLLLGRAIFFPRGKMTIKQVGISETMLVILFGVTVLLAFPG